MAATNIPTVKLRHFSSSWPKAWPSFFSAQVPGWSMHAHLLVDSKVRSRTPHLEAGPACLAAVEPPLGDLSDLRHPQRTVFAGHGDLVPTAIRNTVSWAKRPWVDVDNCPVIWREKEKNRPFLSVIRTISMYKEVGRCRVSRGKQ